MTHKKVKIFFSLVIVSLLTLLVVLKTGVTQKPNTGSTASKQADILGPVEEIQINSIDYATPSRVDTGAKSSSLHAQELSRYTRNGEDYIRFQTVDENGNEYEMNRKIHHLIKVTNTSGVPEKRYVIREQVELKGRTFWVNINLKDRSNMKYKFLMGRDLIKKGNFLVDVRKDNEDQASA